MTADDQHDELPEGPVQSTDEVADRLLALSIRLDALFESADELLHRVGQSETFLEEAIRRLPPELQEARVDVGSLSLLPTLRRCLSTLNNARAVQRSRGGGS